MPIDEVKSLVKNLADKLEESNHKNEQLEAENTELKNRLRELIGEQKLPDFKEKKESKEPKEKDPNPEYKEPKRKALDAAKEDQKSIKLKLIKK